MLTSSRFHCCVSNNGMLTSSLSIVVRQTMTCWRQHFPLCVNLHTWDSLRSWSTYGACRNRLCVESDWRKMMFWIRNPDPLSGSSPKFNGYGPCVAGYLPIILSFKSVHNFLSNPANRQTNKQYKHDKPDKQTNGDEYITFAQLRWRM